MSETAGSAQAKALPLSSPQEAVHRLAELSAKTQRLLQNNLQNFGTIWSGPLDPTPLWTAFADLSARLSSDPFYLAQAQLSLWQDYVGLWSQMAKRMLGQEVEATVTEAPGDRRFKHAAWTDELVFHYLKQSYLIGSRWLQNLVANVKGLDPTTKRTVEFATKQYIDALSPSNFAMTNPEVIRKAVETGGESLLRGLCNFLEDIVENRGVIKRRGPEGFELGKNIAATPGMVVYQNDLMQLIQYAPTTEHVLRRPLLLVPPWVNKFYLFDLKPDNSFIKWFVDQGVTVFALSWVNPSEAHGQKDFENYMTEGPLAALDAIEQATGERAVNVVGYCLGGTLTAATLAYMAAKQDDRIKSATLIAALTDFADLGEFAAIINDQQLNTIESYTQRKGYVEGQELAQLFGLVRANDLIWSSVISNYLLADEAVPSDMLFWFADPVGMPGKMIRTYMRQIVLDNDLTRPGALTLKNTPIDLGAVREPVCIIALRDDHVAGWETAYAGTRLFGGPVRFILGGSGHNAGVINPPKAKKHGYWLNDSLPATSDEWLAGATRHEGSWWPEWLAWLKSFDSEEVEARQIGGGKLKALEPAPGSYALARV
jgi:polyhydroxyalkanoate synthase subunit PhaC